jgi:hypothetical protein
MSDQPGLDAGTWLSLEEKALRARLAAAALAVAMAEEHVAETLDRLAATRPRDAGRLLGRAAAARDYAAVERHRAARWAPGLSS